VAVRPADVILELKFGGDMPSAFKQLVEAFALEPRAVSKYRSSMSVLEPGLGRDGAESPETSLVPVGNAGPSYA